MALDVEVHTLLLQFILISTQDFAEDSMEGGQQSAALLRHLVGRCPQIQSANIKKNQISGVDFTPTMT